MYLSTVSIRHTNRISTGGGVADSAADDDSKFTNVMDFEGIYSTLIAEKICTLFESCVT